LFHIWFTCLFNIADDPFLCSTLPSFTSPCFSQILYWTDPCKAPPTSEDLRGLLLFQGSFYHREGRGKRKRDHFLPYSSLLPMVLMAKRLMICPLVPLSQSIDEVSVNCILRPLKKNYLRPTTTYSCLFFSSLFHFILTHGLPWFLPFIARPITV
jgi:hypothetical protein